MTRAWRVSLYTDGSQKNPTVSLNRDGNGVIAYTDLFNGQIRFRKISSYGLDNGQDDFVVQYAEPDALITSAVSITGEFFIGWSQGTAPNDSIMVRKFDATGVAMGLPFKANTFGGGNFSGPIIAVSDSGWFTVAWNNSTQDGTLHNESGVYAQLFDPTGAKVGPEFAVPNQRDYSQGLTSVFMDADADIAVFWTDFGNSSATNRTEQLRFFSVDLAPQFGSNTPFTVPENSPAGTVVGTVSASDPDPGSTLGFELQGTSPFQINALTGQIAVANGAALDFETQPNYVLTVRVTSGAKSTLGTVQIDLTNVNEAPTLTLNPGVYLYTPGGVPARFADPFVLTDLDSSVFNAGKITATITQNGTADDRIGLSTSLGVSVNSGNVILNGVVVGTIASFGQGSTPFQINLNANATLGVVQTLLNSPQFEVLST
ncbi:MAG: cadherin repeat domain-containing protein [Planctomycetales bacterium]